MFLQRVCAFFLYLREKIFGCRFISGPGFEISYLPVSENESVNELDNKTQCTVFFDSENGTMYNKL